MKAITLWQPYASAIALQQKRYETRSWPTRYRGRLAIHAAVRQHETEHALFANILGQLHTLDYEAWDAYCECQYEYLPFGEIVAFVDLVDCIPVERVSASPLETMWGDYAAGRFAWKLANIERLSTPIPAVGRQGLWDYSPAPSFQPDQQLCLL